MILETRLGRMQKSLETIYDEFIDGYLQGNFTEGVCSQNGDYALMSPDSVRKRFIEKAKLMGNRKYEYDSVRKELEDWVDIHLGNLESKFR